MPTEKEYKLEKVKTAIREAERFIVKAKIAVRIMKGMDEYIYPSKHIAAMKRASMDLTRALAELRRP